MLLLSSSICILGMTLILNFVPSTRCELMRKIIGGEKISWDTYPFMTSLIGDMGDGTVRLCGGTIIHSRWILTAAHCLADMRSSEIKIFIGSTRFARGDEFTARRLLPHTGFNGQKDDIALIELETAVTFGAGQKIRLNRERELPVGTSATLIGWGLTEGSDLDRLTLERIPELHSVQRRIVDCSRTSIIDLFIGGNRASAKLVCTSTMDGRGACVGDSGGPLVVGRIQVGVVSRGTPCAMGPPDVYTNVAPYLPWIEKMTGLMLH